MELTTRCPQCGTVFSASLQQLQLRKGYVRCVNCAHIFDGYEAVVGDGEEQAAPAPSTPAPATPPMPSVLRQRAPGAEAGRGAHADVGKEPVMASGPAAPADAQGRFTISSGLRDDGQADEPVFHLGSGAVPAARPEPTVEPLPARQAPVRAQHSVGVGRATAASDDSGHDGIYVPPRGEGKAADVGHWDGGRGDDRPSSYSGVMRVFWGVLIVAGLLVLLAQLAYVYRAQIANNIPMLRPALEQACMRLHCTVAYERRIDAISIMSSSLRAGTGATVGEGAAKAETGSMTLQLTLRNTYDRPQEWPTLVLDLTDFSGTLVVRKNLRPEDYLGPELRQRPFAAGSELTVALPISLGSLQVNGYQLSKFFQ